MNFKLTMLSRPLLAVACAACVFMLVIINLDVLLKYAMNQPIPGTLEAVSYYAMPLIVFASFAYVQERRLNIEISLLTDRLPRRGAVMVEGAAGVLSIIYLLAFAYASVGSALHATEVGETTGIIHYEMPIWLSRWIVPVGIAVTAVVMLAQLYRHFAKQSGSKE